MTANPHQLYAVQFTEADQARLVGFSCGDAPWSREAERLAKCDLFKEREPSKRQGVLV